MRERSYIGDDAMVIRMAWVRMGDAVSSGAMAMEERGCLDAMGWNV